MDIKIQGAEEIRKVYSTLEDRYNIYRRGLKIIMWRALTLLEASIVKNIRKNFRVGTGSFINSIAGTKKVYDDGDDVVGEIGAGVKYAAIHEFGGQIYPKKKFLAIPMDEVRGPDGMARSKPMDYFGKSFFFRSKRGNLFLAMSKGKGELVPLFLMKESVTIPARPYLRPSLEENQKRIMEKFGLYLQANFDINKTKGELP